MSFNGAEWVLADGRRIPLYTDREPLNFELFMDIQRDWSLETFGPGHRTEALCDHIVSEIDEVLANPNEVKEWIDLVILALDGAWRTGASSHEIAVALRSKQRVNLARDWEDYDPDETSESEDTGRSR